MSFDEGSRSPSSQVPLYLWGGSKVYKKRFVSNRGSLSEVARHLCCSHTRWRGLTALLTDNVPLVDPNDPNAKIISHFVPSTSTWASHSRCRSSWKSYFMLWSVLQANVLQMCTEAIIGFDRMNHFFKLDLMVQSSFTSSRWDATRSTPRFVYAMPSCLIVSAKEITYGMLMCWRSKEGGKARSATVYFFPSPTMMVCHTILICFNFIQILWCVTH